jgi:hydroxyacylglutathione hydrolase
MHVEIIPVLGDNYVYVLSRSGSAVVVDPGAARPVAAYLQRQALSLEAILLTHHHGDHTGGSAGLKAAFGGEVCGPADPRLGPVDVAVRGGDELRLLETAFTVLATPGHTRSHVAYYCAEFQSLWSGDALFTAGCGRLLEGDAAQMWQGLRRLRDLPDAVRLYGGHEYTEENLAFAAHLEPRNRAVAERRQAVRALRAAGKPSVPASLRGEKATNPFLRADEAGLAEAAGLRGAPAETVFAALRHRKDRW